MIDKSVSQTQKTIQVIQDQFQSQNQNLQKRLSARKKRMQKKSQSFSGGVGGNNSRMRKNFSCSTLLFDDQEKTNASAFPNIADQSTQIESQIQNKKEKKILIDNSFLSQDPFDNSIDDDISQSGLSISASMVQQKIQEDLQKEMSQLWAQTQEQIALMNKQRDDKVEQVLEMMAEEKCEKILDLKLKYDIAQQNLQKKPLPIKLKNIMADKITKEKQEQIKKLTKQLDQKKKSQINSIKQEFEQKRRNSIKGSQIEQTLRRMKTLSRATYSVKSKSTKRSSSRKTLKQQQYNQSNIDGGLSFQLTSEGKYRSQTEAQKVLSRYQRSKQQQYQQRDLTKAFDLNAFSALDIKTKLQRKNTTGNINDKVSPIKAFNLKNFNQATTPKSSNKPLRIFFDQDKSTKSHTHQQQQKQNVQQQQYRSISNKNLLPIVQQQRSSFLEKQ